MSELRPCLKCAWPIDQCICPPTPHAELRRCPFCGGHPIMTVQPHGPEENMYYVECIDCEARGASVISASPTVKYHAAQLWNRRAPDAEAQEGSE
jgi:Lar family restriction alleviation protein